MIIGLTAVLRPESTVSAYLAQRASPFSMLIARLACRRKGIALFSKACQAVWREILMADGRLDRTRLAALAFSSKEATQDLNAIVHGAIKEERDAFLRLHKDDSLVVIDAPLLLEGPLGKRM